MSKNIVIQEGGVGRQFTADKLTTPLVEGGTCNWVPEDEVQLETKFITENGTYVAKTDGKYGYSQVTVNVSSVEKIITGTTDSGEPVVTTIDVVDGSISEIILGDYFIVTYDKDGNIAKIEDNNGNACILTFDGETISGFDDIENNHYTIIFDSDGNISQVINPNAQECELKDRDGDGKIDIISIGTVMRVVEDIDTGEIKIIDENDNDVTDDYIGTSITGVDDSDTSWRTNITDSTSGGGASVGITPVTPATTQGAAIIGTDADTGNTVIASIDNAGNIVVEKIPSEIRVSYPPTFTGPYNNGAPILFDGLVVTAYDANGESMGNVAINDLVFPVKNADVSQITEDDGERDVTGTDLNSPVYLVPLAVGMSFAGLIVKNVEGSPYGYVSKETNSDDSNDVIAIVSYSESSVTVARQNGSFPVTYSANILYENGDKSCFRSKEYLGGPGIFGSLDVPYSSWQNYGAGTAAAIALIGTTPIGGVQVIPVQWHLEEEVILETSFNITVAQDGGGGGGGGEGGGDSPVPEGVTIQDLNIAIYNAMNAGQDYIEIDGKQYTIAEAQAMIDYLISH